MAEKKSLEGVVVKLSEVNKWQHPDGRIFILHCNCLKPMLFKEECIREEVPFSTGRRYKPHDFAPLPHVCPKCHLYPWMVTKEMHKSEMKKGE